MVPLGDVKRCAHGESGAVEYVAGLACARRGN